MTTPHSHFTEASLSVASKVAITTTQVSAGATMLGALAERFGMSVNEFFLLIGVCISLLGLVASVIIQWVWKKREFELKKEHLKWDRRQRMEQVARDRRNKENGHF